MGARGALAAENLEALVVHGRRDLYRDRIAHAALAGEPVALADERVSQLHLVHDRGRRDDAGDELDAARSAAPAPAAGRLDVDPCGVGGDEDGRAGFGLEGEPGGQEGERHRRHAFEDTTSPLTSPRALPIVTAPHEPLGASGPQVIRKARC